MYLSTKPGKERWGRVSDRLKVHGSEGLWGNMPFNQISRASRFTSLGCQFDGTGYNTTDEVQTLASGTIAPAAGGLLFTTAASTTAVVTRSTRTVTPATGQTWKAVVKVASTTAATCGVLLNLAAVSTTPFTNTTDMIQIHCPSNSAALTATVRGNSGTAATLTSFNIAGAAAGAVSLVDVTNKELGIEFYIGATAAECWGLWWIGEVSTPFTAAQIVQLFAMMTTPAALARHFSVLPDGSARTVTVQYLMANVFEA